MNVQRFTGRTNKLALEQVRAAMGSEALILSNKRTAEGVEICAMLESGSIVSAIEQAKPASETLMGGTNEIALAHLKRELTDLRETLHAALGERQWQDSAGNPLTYCCVDTTVRQYSRFGLLFARNGNWNGEQIIPADYVEETFTPVWDSLNSDTINQNRGYSMHWWISNNDERGIIFNASGKFGQYIFVDRANDVVFTRITKYQSTGGSQQNWGLLRYINWFGSVDFRVALAQLLDRVGLVKMQGNINTPVTFEDGTSDEFFRDYSEIIDALIAASQP